MYKHFLNLILFMLCISLHACAPKQPEAPTFIYIKNGQFIKNNQPYYYIGANFWYGAILASEEEQGLNSVFATDSTIDVIRSAHKELNRLLF